MAELVSSNTQTLCRALVTCLGPEEIFREKGWCARQTVGRVVPTRLQKTSPSSDVPGTQQRQPRRDLTQSHDTERHSSLVRGCGEAHAQTTHGTRNTECCFLEFMEGLDDLDVKGMGVEGVTRNGDASTSTPVCTSATGMARMEHMMHPATQTSATDKSTVPAERWLSSLPASETCGATHGGGSQGGSVVAERTFARCSGPSADGALPEERVTAMEHQVGSFWRHGGFPPKIALLTDNKCSLKAAAVVTEGGGGTFMRGIFRRGNFRKGKSSQPLEIPKLTLPDAHTAPLKPPDFASGQIRHLP